MDIVFDTDIGDDIDDAMALALVLRSPELRLKAVVTNNRHEGERALIASKLLRIAGRVDVPVYRGRRGGKGRLSQGRFIRDYRDAHVGQFEDFLQLLKGVTSAAPQNTVYLSLGCLTNAASVLDGFSHAARRLRFVIMGGSLHKDYRGNHRPTAEWNIFSDVQAARKVFSAGAEITMVGLDATWDVELPEEQLNMLGRSQSPLNRALGELVPQWKAFYPERRLILYDPFTVGILMDPSLSRWEEVCLEVDVQGLTKMREGAPNVRAAVDGNRERFLELFVNRLLEEEVGPHN